MVELAEPQEDSTVTSRCYAEAVRVYGDLVRDWLKANTVREEELISACHYPGNLQAVIEGTCHEKRILAFLPRIDALTGLDWREVSFTTLKKVLCGDEDELICILTYTELLDQLEEVVKQCKITVVARSLGYVRAEMLHDLFRRQANGDRTRKYMRTDKMVGLMELVRAHLQGNVTALLQVTAEAATDQAQVRTNAKKERELRDVVLPAPVPEAPPKTFIDITPRPLDDHDSLRAIYQNQLAIMRAAVGTLELLKLKDAIHDGDRLEGLQLMKKFSKVLGINEKVLYELLNTPSLTVHDFAAVTGGGLHVRH